MNGKAGKMAVRRVRGGVLAALAWVAGLSACRSPETHRREADTAGIGLVDAHRRVLCSNAVPFSIERPSDTFRRRLLETQGLPGGFNSAMTNVPSVTPVAEDAEYTLALGRALRISVANSREYQDEKEKVFASALELDLQSDAFRSTFAGLVSASYVENHSGDSPQRGAGGSVEPGVKRALKTGGEVGAKLAFDVAQMLTGDRDSFYGILADVSLSIPLLRGSARDIVMEPLTQAERNLVYAIQRFERFKRTFAVDVVRSHYAVLGQEERVQNQEENLLGIAMATRRAEELGKAGRVSEVQVNLSRQNELSARDKLASAREAVTGRLDQYKVQMGLPADARIRLDPAALKALKSPTTEPVMTEDAAVRVALERRLDLQIARGKVEDARRSVRVAEDALRAGMTLDLSGTAGERRPAGSSATDNGALRVDRGNFRAVLGLQLPWERTAERNAYRESLIALDAAQRSAEAAEDEVKSDVRTIYRTLRQSQESCAIQEQALALARRRVESTELLLEAGRAEMRDLVEARDALLEAQNSLTTARISYRMAELDLWRTTEMLEVTEDGVMGDVHVARQ